MSPQRIQLRRTKGWRKPLGAIVVSRPSRWGNPFRIVRERGWWRVEHIWPQYCENWANGLPSIERARQEATGGYRWALENYALPYTIEDVQRELVGRDLCCWCPPTPLNPNGSMDWLGLQCHAEVLLEYANLETSQ